MLRLTLHRLPGAAVLGLAGWTLLAHVCTALGLGLIALEIAAALALVGAAILHQRMRSGPGAAREGARSAPGVQSPPRSHAQRFVLVLLTAIALVGAYRWSESLWVLSVGGAVLVGAGLALRARERQDDGDPPPPRSRAGGILLLALALACAVLVLVAHAPDPDDAFYLNVAAQVATSPGAPLLTEDGIFGIEGMPIQLPVYRAHGIEVLVGAMAHLTGTEPIIVAHLVLAAIAGFLLPLAAARLLHRIVPGTSVLGAFLVVVVLVASGEGEQGPGHFALLRLHQGKGILLAVALPMLIEAALAYAVSPTRRRWIGLAAAQIAAVGLSSSALFVVPLLSTLTLLSAWRGRGGRALGLGLLTSAHAALVLAWVGPPMREIVEALSHFQPENAALGETTDLALQTLERTMGTSPWAAVLLVLALVAWAVPRSPSAGRALGCGLLVAMLVFLCPPVATWLAEGLLAPEVYFRSLWIVPWSVLAAVTLLAPLHVFASPSPARARAMVAVTTVLAVGLPALTSAYSVLSSRAGTRVDLPGPKVPLLEYEAARWVATDTPHGAQVLVPDDVAPWVSTFRSLTHPLYSRYIYERFLLLGLPEEEVYQRRTLTGFVGRKGLHLDRTDVLCHHAELRDLQGIVLRRFGEATVAQGRELAQCGFRRAGQNERYDVWVRTVRP